MFAGHTKILRWPTCTNMCHGLPAGVCWGACPCPGWCTGEWCILWVAAAGAAAGAAGRLSAAGGALCCCCRAGLAAGAGCAGCTAGGAEAASPPISACSSHHSSASQLVGKDEMRQSARELPWVGCSRRGKERGRQIVEQDQLMATQLSRCAYRQHTETRQAKHKWPTACPCPAL